MTNPQQFLNHKPLVDQYLNLQPHDLSPFHFSSIFLWQDFFEFEFAVIEDCLCIFAHQPKASFLYLPPLAKTQQLSVMEECFKRMNAINPRTARIENIDDAGVEMFGDRYKAYKKAEEYVYRKQDLIELKGHTYKSQRHDIHLFQSNYQSLFRPYASEDKEGCLKLYEQWAANRHDKHEDENYRSMLEENQRVHELALSYHEPLGLVGYVVEVGQEIVAYSLGYVLNPHIFCVLLEITDTNYKGASAFIFHRFASSESLKQTTLINTMDDFNLPFVAASKQAYHPIQKPSLYTLSEIR